VGLPIVMASQGVNVLRWSALFGGVFYGLYHQSTLNTQAKHAEHEREYKHKESLIAKAKAEWAKKTAPADTKNGRTYFPKSTMTQHKSSAID
jgi:F-type H+-transporting ATP synthase subunit e